MAVFVTSSRYNRVFFPPTPVRIPSVSSRLRRVLMSSCIYSERLTTTMRRIWSSPFFWVSSKYCMSPPAADMASGRSAQPKPSRLDTSKCFFSTSVARLSWNTLSGCFSR